VADTPRTFVGPNAPRETAVRYLVRERYPVPAEYVSDLLDVLDAAREVMREVGFDENDHAYFVYTGAHTATWRALRDAIERFEAGAQEETT
jgi:hypothetical protein